MIDLLVVSHQTRDLLLRLVNTLHADYLPDVFRLYITDNGSTDGTKELLQQLHADTPVGLKGAWMNGNVGYAAACNYMASQTSSDILGLLNADVWLTTGDVAAVQQIFDNDPSVSILGPKQRNEEGFITHAGIVGTNERPQHRGWKQRDTDDHAYRDQVECVTVSGAAYFIRRSVWDELDQCPTYRESLKTIGFEESPGAFLPTQHYYEETWASYHARAHGHRVVYDGRVSIGHTWHASSPVGGEADQLMKSSKRVFQTFCAHHGIAHD